MSRSSRKRTVENSLDSGKKLELLGLASDLVDPAIFADLEKTLQNFLKDCAQKINQIPSTTALMRTLDPFRDDPEISQDSSLKELREYMHNVDLYRQSLKDEVNRAKFLKDLQNSELTADEKEMYKLYFNNAFSLCSAADLAIISEYLRIMREYCLEAHSLQKTKKEKEDVETVIQKIQQHQNQLAFAMFWHMQCAVDTSDPKTINFSHYPADWYAKKHDRVLAQNNLTAILETKYCGTRYSLYEKYIEPIEGACVQLNMVSRVSKNLMTIFARHIEECEFNLTEDNNTEPNLIEDNNTKKIIVRRYNKQTTNLALGLKLLFFPKKKLFLPVGLNSAVFETIPNTREAESWYEGKHGLTNWKNRRINFLKEFSKRSFKLNIELQKLHLLTKKINTTPIADLADSCLLKELLIAKDSVNKNILTIEKLCEFEKSKVRFKKKGFFGDWTFTKERANTLALIEGIEGIVATTKNDANTNYQKIGTDCLNAIADDFIKTKPSDINPTPTYDVLVTSEHYHAVTRDLKEISDDAADVYAESNILGYFMERLFNQSVSFLVRVSNDLPDVYCLSDDFYALENFCKNYGSLEEKAAIDMLTGFIKGETSAQYFSPIKYSMKAYQEWLRGGKIADICFGTGVRQSPYYKVAKMFELLAEKSKHVSPGNVLIDPRSSPAVGTESSSSRLAIQDTASLPLLNAVSWINKIQEYYLQFSALNPNVKSILTEGKEVTTKAQKNSEEDSQVDQVTKSLIGYIEQLPLATSKNPIGLLHWILARDVDGKKVEEIILAMQNGTAQWDLKNPYPHDRILFILMESKQGKKQTIKDNITLLISVVASKRITSILDNLDAVTISQSDLSIFRRVVALEPNFFFPAFKHIQDANLSLVQLKKLWPFVLAFATLEQRAVYLKKLFDAMILDTIKPFLEDIKHIKEQLLADNPKLTNEERVKLENSLKPRKINTAPPTVRDQFDVAKFAEYQYFLSVCGSGLSSADEKVVLDRFIDLYAEEMQNYYIERYGDDVKNIEKTGAEIDDEFKMIESIFDDTEQLKEKFWQGFIEKNKSLNIEKMGAVYNLVRRYGTQNAKLAMMQFGLTFSLSQSNEPVYTDDAMSAIWELGPCLLQDKDLENTGVLQLTSLVNSVCDNEKRASLKLTRLYAFCAYAKRERSKFFTIPDDRLLEMRQKTLLALLHENNSDRLDKFLKYLEDPLSGALSIATATAANPLSLQLGDGDTVGHRLMRSLSPGGSLNTKFNQSTQHFFEWQLKRLPNTVGTQASDTRDLAAKLRDANKYQLFLKAKMILENPSSFSGSKQDQENVSNFLRSFFDTSPYHHDRLRQHLGLDELSYNAFKELLEANLDKVVFYPTEVRQVYWKFFDKFDGIINGKHSCSSCENAREPTKKIGAVIDALTDSELNSTVVSQTFNELKTAYENASRDDKKHYIAAYESLLIRMEMICKEVVAGVANSQIVPPAISNLMDSFKLGLKKIPTFSDKKLNSQVYNLYAFLISSGFIAKTKVTVTGSGDHQEVDFSKEKTTNNIVFIHTGFARELDDLLKLQNTSSHDYRFVEAGKDIRLLAMGLLDQQKKVLCEKITSLLLSPRFDGVKTPFVFALEAVREILSVKMESTTSQHQTIIQNDFDEKLDLIEKYHLYIFQLHKILDQWDRERNVPKAECLIGNLLKDDVFKESLQKPELKDYWNTVLKKMVETGAVSPVLITSLAAHVQTNLPKAYDAAETTFTTILKYISASPGSTPHSLTQTNLYLESIDDHLSRNHETRKKTQNFLGVLNFGVLTLKEFETTYASSPVLPLIARLYELEKDALSRDPIGDIATCNINILLCEAKKTLDTALYFESADLLGNNLTVRDREKREDEIAAAYVFCKSFGGKDATKVYDDRLRTQIYPQYLCYVVHKNKYLRADAVAPNDKGDFKRLRYNLIEKLFVLSDAVKDAESLKKLSEKRDDKISTVAVANPGLFSTKIRLDVAYVEHCQKEWAGMPLYDQMRGLYGDYLAKWASEHDIVKGMLRALTQVSKENIIKNMNNLKRKLPAETPMMKELDVLLHRCSVMQKAIDVVQEKLKGPPAVSSEQKNILEKQAYITLLIRHGKTKAAGAELAALHTMYEKSKNTPAFQGVQLNYQTIAFACDNINSTPAPIDFLAVQRKIVTQGQQLMKNAIEKLEAGLTTLLSYSKIQKAKKTDGSFDETLTVATAKGKIDDINNNFVKYEAVVALQKVMKTLTARITDSKGDADVVRAAFDTLITEINDQIVTVPTTGDFYLKHIFPTVKAVNNAKNAWENEHKKTAAIPVEVVLPAVSAVTGAAPAAQNRPVSPSAPIPVEREEQGQQAASSLPSGSLGSGPAVSNVVVPNSQPGSERSASTTSSNSNRSEAAVEPTTEEIAVEKNRRADLAAKERGEVVATTSTFLPPSTKKPSSPSAVTAGGKPKTPPTPTRYVGLKPPGT